MKDIEFRYLEVGDKCVINGLEYTKTNHGRSFRLVNGKKEYIYVKKSKLVSSEVRKFDIEVSK